MIRVIKPGRKEFEGQCSKCACIFSYELSDLILGIGEYRVRCPECSKDYYHPSQNNYPFAFERESIPTINLRFDEEK